MLIVVRRKPYFLSVCVCVCVSDNVDMKIKPDKLRDYGICVLKHITYHKN